MAGRCWILYSSLFLCVSAHYLIFPRVSFLVVWGLGVSSPTFKRLFSSSLLSTIKVASSSYLEVLLFLLAVLILACEFYSPALHMISSAYNLHKQGDNLQPWQTPFFNFVPVHFPCPVLTVASCPAYRFLRRQLRWTGILISLGILQFVVIHPVKGFSIVNVAEVDFFVFGIMLLFLRASLDHTAKNLPATLAIWIWSLGWEDTLEKGMATHFRILAWRIL